MPNKNHSAPLGASYCVVSFLCQLRHLDKANGRLLSRLYGFGITQCTRACYSLPIAVFYRHLEPLRLKQNWRYIAGMIVAALFTWGPLYYAILHAGVGISLAIAYASIVIGSFFFGWLFGREHFTKDKAVSAVLGIVGLGLIFSPSTGHLGWLALVGALVSGLSAGANTVFSKQIHYNATQSTIALWVTSVIANFFMAFILQEHQPTIAWDVQWLYLVFFAIASVVASWSLVKGVKLIDAGAQAS